MHFQLDLCYFCLKHLTNEYKWLCKINENENITYIQKINKFFKFLQSTSISDIKNNKLCLECSETVDVMCYYTEDCIKNSEIYDRYKNKLSLSDGIESVIQICVSKNYKKIKKKLNNKINQKPLRISGRIKNYTSQEPTPVNRNDTTDFPNIKSEQIFEIDPSHNSVSCNSKTDLLKESLQNFLFETSKSVNVSLPNCDNSGRDLIKSESNNDVPQTFNTDVQSYSQYNNETKPIMPQQRNSKRKLSENSNNSPEDFKEELDVTESFQYCNEEILRSNLVSFMETEAKHKNKSDNSDYLVFHEKSSKKQSSDTKSKKNDTIKISNAKRIKSEHDETISSPDKTIKRHETSFDHQVETISEDNNLVLNDNLSKSSAEVSVSYENCLSQGKETILREDNLEHPHDLISTSREVLVSIEENVPTLLSEPSSVVDNTLSEENSQNLVERTNFEEPCETVSEPKEREIISVNQIISEVQSRNSNCEINCSEDIAENNYQDESNVVSENIDDDTFLFYDETTNFNLRESKSQSDEHEELWLSQEKTVTEEIENNTNDEEPIDDIFLSCDELSLSPAEDPLNIEPNNADEISETSPKSISREERSQIISNETVQQQSSNLIPEKENCHQIENDPQGKDSELSKETNKEKMDVTIIESDRSTSPNMISENNRKGEKNLKVDSTKNSKTKPNCNETSLEKLLDKKLKEINQVDVQKYFLTTSDQLRQILNSLPAPKTQNEQGPNLQNAKDNYYLLLWNDPKTSLNIAVTNKVNNLKTLPEFENKIADQQQKIVTPNLEAAIAFPKVIESTYCKGNAPKNTDESLIILSESSNSESVEMISDFNKPKGNLQNPNEGHLKLDQQLKSPLTYPDECRSLTNELRMLADDPYTSKISNQPTKHTCEICDKEFSRKSKLDSHKKIHNTEKINEILEAEDNILDGEFSGTDDDVEFQEEWDTSDDEYEMGCGKTRGEKNKNSFGINGEVLTRRSIETINILDDIIEDTDTVSQPIKPKSCQQTIPQMLASHKSISQFPVRQQSIPQGSIGQQLTPQITIGQHLLTQNPIGQQSIPQVSIGQQLTPQISIGQQSIPQVPYSQQSISQGSIGQQLTPQIPIGQHLIPQNPIGQHSIPQVSIGQQLTPQIPVGQQLIPQNLMSQQSMPPILIGQHLIPQNPIGQQSISQVPISQQSISESSIGQQLTPQISVGQQLMPQNLIGQQSKPAISIGQQIILQNPCSQQSMSAIPMNQHLTPQIPIGKQLMSQNLIGQQPMSAIPIGQYLIPQNPIGQQSINQVPIGQQSTPQIPLGQKILSQFSLDLRQKLHKLLHGLPMTLQNTVGQPRSHIEKGKFGESSHKKSDAIIEILDDMIENNETISKPIEPQILIGEKIISQVQMCQQTISQVVIGQQTMSQIVTKQQSNQQTQIGQLLTSPFQMGQQLNPQIQTAQPLKPPITMEHQANPQIQTAQNTMSPVEVVQPGNHLQNQTVQNTMSPIQMRSSQIQTAQETISPTQLSQQESPRIKTAQETMSPVEAVQPGNLQNQTIQQTLSPIQVDQQMASQIQYVPQDMSSNSTDTQKSPQIQNAQETISPTQLSQQESLQIQTAAETMSLVEVVQPGNLQNQKVEQTLSPNQVDQKTASQIQPVQQDMSSDSTVTQIQNAQETMTPIRIDHQTNPQNQIVQGAMPQIQIDQEKKSTNTENTPPLSDENWLVHSQKKMPDDGNSLIELSDDEFDTESIDRNQNIMTGSGNAQERNNVPTSGNISDVECDNEFCESEIFPCKVCGKKFTKKKYLIRHSDIHLNNCRFCHKHFEKDQERLDHELKIHKNEPRYICEICGYSTFYANAFKKHRNAIHKDVLFPDRELFKCDKCDKEFVLEAYLRRHKQSHKNDKYLECDKCHKKLKNSKSLKAHLLHVHLGERKFECNVCHRRFKTKQILKNHVFLHTDERNFKCSKCDHKSKTKAAWLKHLESHSTELKYQCDLCPKKFTAQFYLARHRVYHIRKPHKCTICNAEFTAVHNLRNHKRKHDEGLIDDKGILTKAPTKKTKSKTPKPKNSKRKTEYTDSDDTEQEQEETDEEEEEEELTEEESSDDNETLNTTDVDENDDAEEEIDDNRMTTTNETDENSNDKDKRNDKTDDVKDEFEDKNKEIGDVKNEEIGDVMDEVDGLKQTVDVENVEVKTFIDPDDKTEVEDEKVGGKRIEIQQNINLKREDDDIESKNDVSESGNRIYETRSIVEPQKELTKSINDVSKSQNKQSKKKAKRRRRRY